MICYDREYYLYFSFVQVQNHELGWLLKDLSVSKQQPQIGLSLKLILIALVALYI